MISQNKTIHFVFNITQTAEEFIDSMTYLCAAKLIFTSIQSLFPYFLLNLQRGIFICYYRKRILQCYK